MAEKEPQFLSEQNKTDDKYVFMREEIKARPINRRKLIRNTFVAATSAVVFGLVACLTFALLSPFILDRVFEKESEDSKSEPQILVSFPEETPEEEMTPQDMLVTTPVQRPSLNLDTLETMNEDEIRELIEEMRFSLADYQSLYSSLTEVAEEAMRSVVKITPFKKSVDWFDYEYESESNLSGAIIGDNGTDLLIVTKYGPVKNNSTLIVTFANDVKVNAHFITADTQTNLCILGVSQNDINEVTREYIRVASIGASSPKLVGLPIIAIGNPVGGYGSISFGTITSASQTIHVIDSNYKQIYTNIVGSPDASGVIINVSGEILGIIDNSFADQQSKSLVGAIGISELKRPLERMMNGFETVYFGITGDNVPEQAVLEGAPKGVYVLSVAMDSPAMKAGIQSGDIIVSMGSSSISKFTDFLVLLRTEEEGKTYPYVVARKSQDTYKNIELEVTFK